MQCPDGSPPPCRGARAAPVTVAVMPFANLSHDSSDDYLASGLTDEITERLAQVERLAVTSAAVMRRYHGDADPRQVATSVHAASLVSGSVRREHQRLRISVELIRARDGIVAWNRSFDQPDSTLLDLQAEIGQNVATAIVGRLLPGERAALSLRRERAPAAYDHYLRGQYAVGLRTPASIERALQEFDLAIQADSAYGDAWAGRAFAYYELGGPYHDTTAGVSRDSADALFRSSAMHAIRVDTLSARAWLAASEADSTHRRAWMERALALSPRDPMILLSLAGVASNAGDSAARYSYLRRAADAAPTDPVTLLNLGLMEYYRRRYLPASRWMDSAIGFRPEAPYFYSDRAHARIQLGDTAGARADVAETRRLGNDTAAAALEVLLALRGGDSAAARAGAAALKARVARLVCYYNFNCFEVALALAAAGDGDGAIALLDRTGPRDGPMPWLDFEEFQALQPDPRFARIKASYLARGRP